ncbi:hypothetical protein [Archangium lansingense]|uniref:Uncharacterized protein n=1 Tax=Archangium lansingense TaxID=2995310 RepID=A0ABT4A125_9BACT|nr:hypothetical protein [Archangium lansinium]MCY1075348.1 hypothetical protein [Archangium lansinium]
MPTDLAIIRNALPTLEAELRQAYEALSELEELEDQERHGTSDQDGPSTKESIRWTKSRMASRAERLFRLILNVLEASGLPGTREKLQGEWAALVTDISEIEWMEELGVLNSPALTLLQDSLYGLKAIAGTSLSAPEEDALRRVETVLKSLPYIMAKRGKKINSEADVQEVLDESMNLMFEGKYESRPEVGGLVKGFTADGGVREQGIIIELKFARSAEDLKRCIEELAADIAGYRGSRDWKYFYAVLIMTEPLITEVKFEAELIRMDAKNWKGFALHLGRSGT